MLYNTEGRLPYLKPEDMTQKQKEFYEIHRKTGRLHGRFFGRGYDWFNAYLTLVKMNLRC